MLMTFSDIIYLILILSLNPKSGIGGKTVKDDNRPIGTFVFLLIFLVMIIGSWLGVYALMLSRGG